MIPGLLATEVSAALREFIVTGYETETDPFKGEFRRLVEALRPSTRLMRTRSRPGRGWLPIDVLRIPW